MNDQKVESNINSLKLWSVMQEARKLVTMDKLPLMGRRMKGISPLQSNNPIFGVTQYFPRIENFSKLK
jgi:hypothetical protein